MTAAPLVFVDTNVLIYSEDHADPVKQALAHSWLEVLWERRIGRLSTQVLNEMYVNMTRKATPPMPAPEARHAVRRFMQWKPWQIDGDTLEAAWALESRYGLHYWDCLVVAAAQACGCTFLLSEDLSHEQRYGDVQVLNPFIAGIERLALPA